MKVKVKFSIKLKKLLGYSYVVNLGTREIHNLKNTHSNCSINMLTNKKFIKKKELKNYLNKKFNGCRYCFKLEDKG